MQKNAKKLQIVIDKQKMLIQSAVHNTVSLFEISWWCRKQILRMELRYVGSNPTWLLGDSSQVRQGISMKTLFLNIPQLVKTIFLQVVQKTVTSPYKRVVAGSSPVSVMLQLSWKSTYKLFSIIPLQKFLKLSMAAVAVTSFIWQNKKILSLIIPRHT